MINRRTFFLSGVASVTAGALAPQLSLASLATGRSELQSSQHQRQWGRLLGESFIVEENGLRLTQLKLSELRQGPKRPLLDQFHLYFTNTGSIELEERSYHLYHPDLGRQDVFLQPILRSSGDPYYRASFALLVDDSSYV